MANIIEKKVWPEYFEKLLDGSKNYELRLNDFECKPGDTLLLKEYDPITKQYTGREITREVTYVGKFKIDELFWSEDEIKDKGIQIISLK